MPHPFTRTHRAMSTSVASGHLPRSRAGHKSAETVSLWPNSNHQAENRPCGRPALRATGGRCPAAVAATTVLGIAVAALGPASVMAEFSFTSCDPTAATQWPACATGYTAITTEDECEAAATALDNRWHGSISSSHETSRPRGCYCMFDWSRYNADKFFFNGHATGANQCDENRPLVCVRAVRSQDPPTPTPTAAPTTPAPTTSWPTPSPTADQSSGYAILGGGALTLLVVLAMIVSRRRQAHAVAARAMANAAGQRPVENAAFAPAPAPAPALAPAGRLQPSSVLMRPSADKGVIYSTASMTEGQNGLGPVQCTDRNYSSAITHHRNNLLVPTCFAMIRACSPPRPRRFL